ncbi:hypothetical protein EON80_12190, partial [bacterium]
MKPLPTFALVTLVTCGAALIGVKTVSAQRPIERPPLRKLPVDRAPVQRPPTGPVIKQVPKVELADSLTFNPTLTGQIKPNFPINAKIVLKSPSILKARGAQSATLLNEDVTVTGFYYDGSIPMVIDDMERTRVDMILPPESYIPLSSKVSSLRNGDEVSLTGRLIDPARSGLRLPGEKSALQIGADVTIRKVKPAASRWKRLDSAALTRIPNLTNKLSDGVKSKYAVIISGGADAANNHIRYWNCVKTMYSILTNSGYKAENIKVIYADGSGRDNSAPVHFSATRAHIWSVFKDIAGKMDAGDDLFVMINDHGGGFLTRDIGTYKVGNYGGVVDWS